MKLMVILSRIPYPLEKGDKLRAYHQIRCLAVKNEIHLVALSHLPVHPEAYKELSKFCKTIRFFKIPWYIAYINLIFTFFSTKPFQVGYFYSRSIHTKISKIISNIEPDHIYCQLIRVAEYVKNANIPKTLDYQDVFSKGVQRRIEKSAWFLKPILKMEYLRLLKYENDIFKYFNHKTIISEPDRQFIPHDQKNEIVIIGNGVDTDYFQPIETEKKYDLVFTGNMGYPPNVDAAVFLVKEILPLIGNRNITLLLAGASPHHRVKSLQSENVTVTGWVDDIRYCYASSRVFIAPMNIGTGLQNKLLEAMAMKLPSITSRLANSALNAKDGSDILVGSTAQEFAKHIIDLLENDQLAEQISINGHQFVIDHFNWEAITGKLNLLFHS